jgi:hypothetical protein
MDDVRQLDDEKTTDWLRRLIGMGAPTDVRKDVRAIVEGFSFHIVSEVAKLASEEAKLAREGTGSSGGLMPFILFFLFSFVVVFHCIFTLSLDPFLFLLQIFLPQI